MNITDGSHILTGSVVWNTIASFGTSTTINLTGTVNLTGITYSGTQSDLQTLATAGSAVDTITLQFTDTTHDLTYLAAT